MISSQQLGERLADARKRTKLTQADVAEAVGVARTTLVAMEKGERRPNSSELLMPATGVQKHFAERCRAGHFTAIDLFALARYFEVSFQAMALRLEDLRLLPPGSYDKITKSKIRPKDLARHVPVTPTAQLRRRKFPERYVTLTVGAYDQELLSEGELADVVKYCERPSARERTAGASEAPTARAEDC